MILLHLFRITVDSHASEIRLYRAALALQQHPPTHHYNYHTFFLLLALWQDVFFSLLFIITGAQDKVFLQGQFEIYNRGFCQYMLTDAATHLLWDYSIIGFSVKASCSHWKKNTICWRPQNDCNFQRCCSTSCTLKLLSAFFSVNNFYMYSFHMLIPTYLFLLKKQAYVSLLPRCVTWNSSDKSLCENVSPDVFLLPLHLLGLGLNITEMKFVT